MALSRTRPTVAQLETAVAAVLEQMDNARSDAEFDRLRPRLENLNYQLTVARHHAEQQHRSHSERGPSCAN